MTSINPQANNVYNVDIADDYRTDDLARVSEVIRRLTFSIGARVIEFGMIPLIACLKEYTAYYMPTLNRVYAWCKFVPFAAIVCGFGWPYDRSRFSR